MLEHFKRDTLRAQKSEIAEYWIYRKLSSVIKNEHNRRLLQEISEDEKKHYEFWRKVTDISLKPSYLKVWYYVLVSHLFGLTFGIKLMERGEDLAQDTYKKLKDVYFPVEALIEDEQHHENELIALIDEERLKYVSSIVLGLNDALVELTGALVGLTLALQDTRLVGIVGLITGIAASLSMSASEYLSTKQEDTKKFPLKASFYTGLAYIITVFFLITPYFIFKNIFLCMGLVLFMAVLVIFIFTYYISIAKSLSFKKWFLEMAGISLGIAVINFFIGLIIRSVFSVET